MSKQKDKMRAMIGFLTAIMSLAICGQLTADPKDSKTPGKAAAKLLGTWKMTAIEQNGQKMQPPIEMVFTFKQDVVEQKAAGRSQTSKYKLDSDNPNHLDILREGGGETRTFKMIFSVEDDTLRMCSGRPGAERPTTFSSAGGYSIQLLERVDTQEK